MDDAEVTKLADVVSTRVFEAMSKFVDVLQGLVRENEELRSKVEYLEIALFGPEDEFDDFDDDDGVGPCGDVNCEACNDFALNGPCADESCEACNYLRGSVMAEPDNKPMRN